MKEVLILSNFIPPEQSATGRIAYHIAKEMSKFCNVHLMCLSSNEQIPDCNNIKINKILTRYGKYQKLIAKSSDKKGFCELISKLCYKVYYKFASKKGLEDSKSHTKIFAKKAKNYIKKNAIDTLITISNPFDIQIVGCKIKNKFNKIAWYPYLMDSNRHNISYKAQGEKEKQIFAKAKKIFIVPALEFDKDFCLDFNDKIKIVQLPIIPTSQEIKNCGVNDKIKLIFAGMFYKDVRDPKNLLELMAKLPQNYSLQLYSAGCADVIKQYKKILEDKIIINGFISPSELEDKISQSNIVINIGNTVLNQVPSKAYDLIATGKPMLNFYQNEKDISLEHLKKYALCLNLDYNNLTQEHVEYLVEWIEQVANKSLGYNEATRNMQEIRLANVVKRIVDIIQ